MPIAVNQLISLRLPNFKRLFTDDFPKDSQAVIEKLCNYVNPNTEYVYTALNNQLSFADNFNATQKSFNVTVDASGTPTSNTIIQLNVINNTIPKASGSLVIRAQNLTNSNIYPTGGVFLSFSQNGSVVTLTNVAGLPANNNFNITAVIFH